MLFTKALILAVAGFVASSAAAPASADHVEARAPHPFSITSPAAGATLEAIDGRNRHQFTFSATDGNLGVDYQVEAWLKNPSTGKATLVLPRIPFDGFTAEAQVGLDGSAFPKGAYELVAKELNAAGTVIETKTQTLHLVD